MENLESVLIDKLGKSPEEVSSIIETIKLKLLEGNSEIDVLTEVFGTDVNYLLEVLGESPCENFVQV